MAGLRLGFAVGHANLIEALKRIKNSFNSYLLDRLAIAGAVAAIEDRDYFEKITITIINTRKALMDNLFRLGFEVLPSSANFVLARHPAWQAEDLAKKLRQRAIIVRHFKQERIKQFIRITVGTDEQNAALCEALRQIFK